MSVAPGRHRRPVSPASRGVVVVLAWLVVVGVAPWHQLSGRMHDAALFLHLAAMVVGFGAVLLVDWIGLLWLAGRRTLADVVHAAQGAHVPTWLGFAGLLVSGLFLGSPADLKAAAVLVAGLNGVYASALLPRLGRRFTLPPQLAIRSVVTAVISQAAWWTAAVLGFLSTRS